MLPSVTARRVALVALYGAVLAHGTWLAAAAVAPVENDPAGVNAGSPATACPTSGAAFGDASTDESDGVPAAVRVTPAGPGVEVEIEPLGRRPHDGTAGEPGAFGSGPDSNPGTGGPSPASARVRVGADTSLCRAVIGVPLRLLIDVLVELGEIETELCGDADPLSLRGLLCLLLNGLRLVVLLLFFVLGGTLSTICDLIEAVT